MTPRGAGRSLPPRHLAPVLVAFLLSIPFMVFTEERPNSIAAMPPGGTIDGAAFPAFTLPRGHFIENRGQAQEGIRYYSTGNPTVAFQEDGFVLVVREERPFAESRHLFGDLRQEPEPSRALAYRVHFEGARRTAPVGADPLPFKSNFFLGNDPAKWRTDVPSYAQIVYEDLYQGIDLAFRSDAKGVKYEFRVHPGSDPATIRLRYEGVRSMRLVDADLAVDTALGEVRDTAPYSYQDAGDLVDCDFTLHSSFTLGFDCGAWDASRTLIIDPLVYATYLGGGGDDRAYGMTVDASGSAYATGRTSSVDFPVWFGVDMTLNGSADAFVVKRDPSGGYISYATFIGGTAEDYGWSVAVDTAGDAYLAAWTYSPDFPTTPGSLNLSGSAVADAWVVKLSPGGNQLLYSAVLGGNGYDEAWDIKLDSNGNAYISGDTTSTDFPTTPGAFDGTLAGSRDVFVAKLNPAGSALVYSTLLGGSLDENGARLAVDPLGNTFVAGHTSSSNFPTTPSAFDIALGGGSDAFVTRLDAAGSSLIYSTYLGGTGSEGSWGGMSIDATGRAWVAGVTSSSDFPITPGAFDWTFGGGLLDGFAAELSPTGDAVLYGSYLGDVGEDWAQSIALDSRGDVYVAGWTQSTGFPVTPDAIDTTFNGVRDLFITRLNATTPSTLVYSTFLGGSMEDMAFSMALDPAGAVYVSGMTDSADFPVTPGAANTSYLGGPEDGFVVKVHASPPLPDLKIESTMIFLSPPGPVNVGDWVSIDAIVQNIGDDNASQVPVRFHDGSPSASNRIGADVTIAFLPHPGFNLASRAWQADPPSGIHDLCVVVDPDDRIAELSEANNEACVPIEVVVPPRPDYVPIDPSPSPPVRIGLSLPLALSIRVRNEGTAPGTGNAIVAFYNESSPGQPFATAVVPPLSPSENSSAAMAVWIAPSMPGFYSVVASVDYLDNVTESNESNNGYTWAIETVATPVTLVQIGQPAYTVGWTYVTSSTPIDFIAVDPGGTGIRATSYRIDGGSWENYTATGSFVLAREGAHLVEWYSEDFAGNVEVAQSSLLRVDDTRPTTALAIGVPKYLIGGTFVTSSTPIQLAAMDGGITPVGLASVEYRIDSGPWLTFAVSFPVSGEGTHTVGYRSTDLLGNAEPTQNVSVLVDDTPPSTIAGVGDPNYLIGGTFVTSSTRVSLAATDGGATPVNVASVEYRIDGAPWNPYAAPFAVPGEGAHRVDFRSTDRLGNVEVAQNFSVIVDDSPPTVSLSLGDPKFPGAHLFITSATPLTLVAADGGVAPVGLVGVEYRIGGTPWTAYAGRFTLPGPDGGRRVDFAATDLLGNRDSAGTDVAVDDTPPITTPSVADGTYAAETTFSFTATDQGSGIASTEYRIDSGTWTPFTGAFALAEGSHVVRFRSSDRLHNTETERSLSVRIEGAPITRLPVSETNWQPLVAAVISTILILIGLWASRRAPWRTSTRPVLRAFVISSLPFVAAESAVGVVSLVTGALAIPPLLGAGAAVDLLVLILGVVTSGYRVRKTARAR